MLVVDGAEVLLQQNWEHVTNTFAAVNRLPTSTHATDFSRVREWSLAGLARHFRQTVVFAGFVDPSVTALLRRPAYAANTAGGLFLRSDYSGTIARVVPTVQQTFHRVPVESLGGADDARLEFFRDRLLPGLLAGCAPEAGCPSGHTLIFVPSYFDYVRLRNLLDAREAEFATCSEYSDDKDVSRARGVFFNGETPLLLATERFHYFRRYKLRGIRHLLFYGPPANAHFYTELLNLLDEAASREEPVSATVRARACGAGTRPGARAPQAPPCTPRSSLTMRTPAALPVFACHTRPSRLCPSISACSCSSRASTRRRWSASSARSAPAGCSRTAPRPASCLCEGI